MKKRFYCLSVVLLFIALAVSVTGCSASQTVDTTAHDEFIAEVEQKAQAALEAIGDSWTMDARTEIVSVPMENAQGDTVIYHACKTTYYDTAPAEATELNVRAIRSVIDPEEAGSAHPCMVGGKPGYLYDKDGRSYLCWTVSPEYSLVIEYTPGAINDYEIFEIAESVPANEW